MAGVTKNGTLIRLFPVPFRLMKDDAKFRKWQWIRARVEKSADSRPESHHIKIDTLQLGETVGTKNAWEERRHILSKLPVYSSPDELEAMRETSDISLGLISPVELLDVEIIPSSEHWDKEDLDKLLQAEKQASLFEEDRSLPAKTLEKLPYDFYYKYACIVGGEEKVFRTKLIDWEVGAAYLKFRRNYKDGWMEKFRQKYLEEFRKKDIQLLLGNHSRFRHQWMIISVVYPPKELPHVVAQGELSL